MVGLFHISNRQVHEGQDHFFLWSMIILPILAQGAYIFDAFYYLAHHTETNAYEGLLSTILIVFAYLRYCSPIECRVKLFVYYIFLCLLNVAGSIGYTIVFVIKKDWFFIVVYVCWALIEICFTIMLIYCRVIWRQPINFIVENRHLFHFMSRLETILAIFIPFFINKSFITLTKDSIAFFLLFDFFSGSYVRFRGIWIKSALYLFVGTVTIAVAAEWLYFVQKAHYYEQISAVSELISACLCNTLIILQFFPYHFPPVHISRIAREGFNFQQRLSLVSMAKAKEKEDQEQQQQQQKNIEVETSEKPIDSNC